MTEEELDAIEARCNRAINGPWHVGEFDRCCVYRRDDEYHTLLIDCFSNPCNASFIARARTDVPELIRELRIAWRKNEHVRERFEKDNEEIWRLHAKLDRQAEHYLRARQEAESTFASIHEELLMEWFGDVLGYIGALEAAQALQRKMENSWAELFTKYLALGGLKDEE